MPDPRHDAVDEQHRKVARLPAGQGSFGRPRWEEQLTRVAAHRVGVEIGQQAHSLRLDVRRSAVAGHHPGRGAVELDLLELIGE